MEWAEKQLSLLRPYSQVFDAWVASKQQDTLRLLRKQALISSPVALDLHPHPPAPSPIPGEGELDTSPIQADII